MIKGIRDGQGRETVCFNVLKKKCYKIISTSTCEFLTTCSELVDEIFDGPSKLREWNDGTPEVADEALDFTDIFLEFRNALLNSELLAPLGSSKEMSTFYSTDY